MKQRCYKVVYISVLLLSCTKSLTKNSSDTNSRITVKEYATNVLLPDVQIKLFTCSHYDLLFGCQATTQFATLLTDQKGECTITNQQLNKANEGMIFSKLQYWDRQGGTGENFMEPEAWAKISLKAINAYPDTSLFVLASTSQLTTKSILSFKAPRDSIINFRLFGNEINTINWMVFTRGSLCYLYCTVDSLNGGSLTLSPQKFENLSASINY